MQLVLNTTVEQALRPQTFRIFWPFISSHYKHTVYPAHMPAVTSPHSMAWYTGHAK